MFDFVHEKKRLVQIVLLLIILPFAFWGVSSYRQISSGDALATVEGEKITQQEFDTALRRQQDKMRELTRGNFDAAMFDRPEVKYSILDNLVSQKLLAIKAHAAGLTLSDDQLAEVIEGFEAFQKNGKFDKGLYKSVLRSQNMTPAVFESRVKQEFAVRQLAEAYTQNGYASNAVADNLIRLNEQQRMISVAHISAEPYLSQAKVNEAAIKNYYESNQQEFHTPELAKVEYVILSADSLQQRMTVSEDEIKQYYIDHQAEYGEPEQRRAAHILIAVPAQASAADKEKARAKAEKVLQQVKQDPSKFAELAKKYSDDPGSASNGGDLGFFGRGMMVKPFEDAAYGLKPGEISGLVQSDFGYHIIKLLAVKAAKIPPLDQVKNTIVQKLKAQKAADKFAELADKFSNTVYEQSDSLKPAAGLVGIPVQQSGWLDKGQPGGLPWNDKALQAVFSDDVLNKKRNSSAVEIAPDTLLSVRLLEHKPAGIRPLNDVSDTIRQKLLHQQADEQAVKEGESLLEKLRHGEKVHVAWKESQTVTRAQHQGLDADLVRRVLQADVSKLPVYVGVESGQGGYVLARINAVKETGAIDDAKRSRYLRQLRQLTGDELLQDYLADAREHASISIKKFQGNNAE
jgi:peptidyl-prolyl cis-trans isomerase D